MPGFFFFGGGVSRITRQTGNVSPKTKKKKSAVTGFTNLDLEKAKLRLKSAPDAFLPNPKVRGHHMLAIVGLGREAFSTTAFGE